MTLFNISTLLTKIQVGKFDNAKLHKSLARRLTYQRTRSHHSPFPRRRNTFISALIMLMMLADVFPASATALAAAGVIDVYPGQDIQTIVNTAPSGTTIYVHAGTYPGFKITTSGLTVSGASGETAVISGQLLLSGLTSGTVSNLDIQGTLTTYQAGLSVSKSSGLTLTNNTIHGNSFGILLDHVTNSTIKSNNLYDNASGLEVHYDGGGVVITANTIHDNNRILDASRGQGGVNFYFSTGAITFADNVITNNLGVGVEIYAASNLTLERNTFTGGSDQIETGTDNNKTACNNLTIRRNIAYKTANGVEQRGFILRCASNGLVANNTLDGLDKFAFDFNGGAYSGSIDNLHVLNNIVVNGRAFSIDFSLPASVVIDYNDVWTTSSSTALYGSQIAYVAGHGSTSSWTTFRSWTGYEAHGLNLDPLLVNPAARDYHLQASSPVIDRGTNVGEAFNGTAPDMGRFETGVTAATPTAAVSRTPTAVPSTATTAPTSTATSTPIKTSTPTAATTVPTVGPTNTPTKTAIASATFALTSTPTNTPGMVSPSATMALLPVDDTYITSSSPNRNYGSAPTLQTDNSPIKHFLLKFNVTGTNGQKVINAKLRLYNVNASKRGGDFYRVSDNSWQEETVIWNNAPTADTALLASLGTVSANTWYEVDLTSLITGDGTYSLRISSSSSNGADYSSKEGANSPQVVITLGGVSVSSATATTAVTHTAPPLGTATSTPLNTPTKTVTSLPPTSTATPLPTLANTPALTPTASSGSVVVVALGDIHSDGNDPEAIANLNMVNSINPTAILGLGDYQYTSGTCSNFTTSGRYVSDGGS